MALYGLLLPAPIRGQEPHSSWYNGLCAAYNASRPRTGAAGAGGGAQGGSLLEQRASLLAARGLVDVTTVLQSMVDKGALALPKGRRARCCCRSRRCGSAPPRRCWWNPAAAALPLLPR
jgi:hypothetical protein